MNNHTRKFFIYTRKSTDTEDRQVRSISDQLAELKQLALKEDIDVVDIFVEKQTAKIPGRPVFDEMLLRIEQNEANGILAWHPDRLARNSVDGGKIIYLLDTGKIAELKFPTFWCDTTPQGKFMLSIAFPQSKYYVDNLSENIKRGKRNKVKDGIWPQMAPLGYINEGGKIVVDENIAPLIKKTFEAYSSGSFTLRQLRDKFNELGLKRKSGKELAVSNYQKLLKNPCSQKYTREEIITSEIQKEIKKVSLPDDWAKWMLAENEKDKLVEVQSSTLFADSTKADISLLDSKIEKLMDAYLENALSLDEYRNMKNKLVNEKQLLKEKLSAFEQKANNRFELTEKFLKYNIELANEGINEEKLHLYKKVGSNFQIKDRTIFFEPRGAWRILLDSEFGGWNAEQTALRADNIFGGNLNSEFWRCVLNEVRMYFELNPDDQ